MAKLFIIGIGPGDKQYLTFEAQEALSRSDIIIGYKRYIEQIQDLISQKEIASSSMRQEIERCKLAIKKVESGYNVGLISGGDAGIYGMAGLVLELLEEKSSIDCQIIPGLPALVAAASRLGAPLMNDFAVISLSDLLTPWEVIWQRLESSLEGDFVIILYNPKSRKRTSQLERVRDFILSKKGSDVLVGIAKNVCRKVEEKYITTIENLPEFFPLIDMSTILFIGNSQTVVRGGKIISPRGYKIK